tara:strand:+ start:41 stop:280 length:240 start_codon:yes stop_codon:yes gene_type:complete
MCVVNFFVNTVITFGKFSIDEFFCFANEHIIAFVRSISYLQKLSTQKNTPLKGASDEIGLVWKKYIGIVIFVVHAFTRS